LDRLALACFSAAALMAGDPEGIAPRPRVSDYQLRAQTAGADFGAELLSQEETRKTFVSDIDRAYVVVELGVFPKDSFGVDIQWRNIVLRDEASGEFYRPASAESIASYLHKSTPKSRDITVQESVSVIYSTGGAGYDPYGRYPPRGVSTQVGVGVGVGDSRPGPVPEDRDTMELELGEQSLPEGIASKPVAGYLYFPVTEKDRKKARLTLEAVAGGQTANFDLGTPKRR
jgi:hypothetical protein